MSEPADPLPGATPCWMEIADYYADFERRFWVAGSFWKLERGQVFAEPGNASWKAFQLGDWDSSLRLLEVDRPALAEYHRKVAAAGFTPYRVRIVEFPINPYLQWELHALRVRAECGGPVRIVTDIAAAESGGQLPEIYTVGDKAMYQAAYDRNGVLAGAYRYSAPSLISRWRKLITNLYGQGEPIADFFGRCVAELPPPTPAPEPPSGGFTGYLDRVGRPRPIRS